jgi:hypothetical protein
MTQLVKGTLQTIFLTVLSAALYVCLFDLNTWIFSSFQHKEGISWVFLPAGFRVILVILLGMSGALGLVLGSWFIARDTLGGSGEMLVLLNGLVSGLTPWVVYKYLRMRRWVSEKLQTLTTRQLLNITLIFSATSAIAHQLLWLLMDHPHANPWVDVWPMFFGNVTGSLLMLYSLKFMLDRVPVPSQN